MKLTVAICTWNRAALLARTLDSLTRLDDSGAEWEIIVVNNNCTDDTDAVIEHQASALPLRRVFEPAAGSSHARNRAIAEARGDLLIFVDDDVLVKPDWLVEYARAFRADPSAALFAGPIDPWFECEPPPWFARHLADLSGVVVAVDHGTKGRELTEGDAIFSANLAVRRDVAANNLFNPRMGKVKTGLMGGEDTDFCARIMRSGGRAVWVPTVRVQHFVPKSRLTWAYVRRWHIDSGRLVVRQWATIDGPLIAGIPRWAIRRFVFEKVKAWVWSPLRNDRWFRSYRQALLLQGIMLESRAITLSTESGN